MNILDLYCCQGGAGMGYHRSGFNVFAVDLDPQPRNPFPFHQGDALGVLRTLLAGDAVDFRRPDGGVVSLRLADFDAVHASPPCQSFLNLGKVNIALGRDYEYPNLIAATRDLIIETGLPYVIENVEDAKRELINPVRICGTGLDRPIRRHRLFESDVEMLGIPCAHSRFTEPKYWTGWRPKGEKRLSTVVQVYGNAGGQHEWPEAMGIDWMDRHGFVEAVPPSYTAWIGEQLLRHIEAAAAA